MSKRAFNLEEEALLASGIRERSEISFCLAGLDRIYQQFLHEIVPPSDLVVKAKALFNWLWISKPNRYKPRGNYRLNEVITAQLKADDNSVGNCLGLTLLYNCLLRKMSIYAEALYVEDAFGIGPHVLTLLQTEKSTLDIENILVNGFDYRGHLTNPLRTRWGNRELIADVYHSLANDLFEEGHFIEALKNYEMAISLNAKYERARLNKEILLDKIGKER